MSKLILALAAAAALPAQSNLQSVLARMDAAGPTFRSMTASVSRVTHTAVINDNSEEQGVIRLMKAKAREVRVFIEFTKPDHKFVSLGERKAEIYTPKIAVVQEFDLGKHRSLMEQFLLLGFGATGKDLVKNYSVRLTGEETIGGSKTARLELTPKSSAVKSHYNRIDLWIADPGGYPMRQRLNEPSGNYLMVTYSDVKLNPDLPASQLELKLPAGVKREFPQK